MINTTNKDGSKRIVMNEAEGTEIQFLTLREKTSLVSGTAGETMCAGIARSIEKRMEDQKESLKVVCEMAKEYELAVSMDNGAQISQVIEDGRTETSFILMGKLEFQRDGKR